MNALSFWAAVISALAWPVAALAIALTFKPQIQTLLTRIKKGKFGSTEFEFEQEVSEIAEETSIAAGPPSAVSAPSVSLATQNPRAAILESWLRLESCAIRVGTHFGLKDTSAGRRSLGAMMRDMQKAQLITTDDAALFSDLRSLRNQAVHDVDFSPSSESAIRYAQLADALRQRLEAKIVSDPI